MVKHVRYDLNNMLEVFSPTYHPYISIVSSGQNRLKMAENNKICIWPYTLPYILKNIKKHQKALKYAKTGPIRPQKHVRSV